MNLAQPVPLGQEQTLNLMRQLSDAGLTLLVSSHDWGNVVDVYDQIVVINFRCFLSV